MVGIVKKKYISETMRIQKSFTGPLREISKALPVEYDKHVILSYMKDFFPNLWGDLEKRYKHYESKDKFLTKVGKKKRYYHESPNVFFFNLPKVKHMTSLGQRTKHKKEFNEESAELAFNCLFEKAKHKKAKYESKIYSENIDLQVVEPLYIDIFISAYHENGITIREKFEIFNEIKKYNGKKVVDFFQRLNDSERNNQIRRMAFEQLQKMGAYVRLRKSFNGKLKSYNIETDGFNVSPEDLYKRLKSGGSVQSKKSFHIFISHSYRDSDLVREVKSCLNNHGLTVYCDWTSDSDFLKRSLVSDYTKMVLKKRIEQSKCIILIETKNSINSDGKFASSWISMEIEYASSINKPIYSMNFYGGIELFERIEYKITDTLEISKSEINRIRT